MTLKEATRGIIPQINNVDDFHKACRCHFAKWYAEHMQKAIEYGDTFIVWSCKTLQNYKAIVACNVREDAILAEYTYNGDKHELYADHYQKLTNECITEL